MSKSHLSETRATPTGAPLPTATEMLTGEKAQAPQAPAPKPKAGPQFELIKGLETLAKEAAQKLNIELAPGAFTQFGKPGTSQIFSTATLQPAPVTPKLILREAAELKKPAATKEQLAIVAEVLAEQKRRDAEMTQNGHRTEHYRELIAADEKLAGTPGHRGLAGNREALHRVVNDHLRLMKVERKRVSAKAIEPLRAIGQQITEILQMAVLRRLDVELKEAIAHDLGRFAPSLLLVTLDHAAGLVQEEVEQLNPQLPISIEHAYFGVVAELLRGQN